MYQDKRGFTVTGWHVQGTSYAAEERQDELAALYRATFPAELPSAPQPENTSKEAFSQDDRTLIARMMKVPRFTALWAGDTVGYD